MKLADIANDIKTHVESGSAWITKAAEELLPGFLDEAARFQANPIVQALEGLVLPPEAEQAVVNLIRAFATVVASAEHPAEPAPAPAPEVPAEPVEQPAPEQPAS